MSLRLPGLRVALAGVAICATLAPGLTCAQADGEAVEALSPEDHRLLETFDPLGLPSVGQARYVKVWTGRMAQGRCCGSSEMARFGFLLSESEDAFEVVHDLWPVRYSKQAPLQGRAARYEELDFEATALKPGRRGFTPGRVSWSQLIRHRARPSAALELVVLARAAFQRGLITPATQLLAQARTGISPRRQSAPSVTLRPRDLEALLARELPPLLFWGAVWSCGQPEVPRAVMLQRFQQISLRFPGSPSASEAEGFASTLALMIDEEARRGVDPAAPELELGTQLRELNAPVDALTFELRDLCSSHTHRYRPSTRHLDDPQSASSRLLALGTVATPRLIELSEDRRLTRVVDPYPRRGQPSSSVVLRYGDIALQILSRQAGRTLSSKDEAVAWWSALQEHGEEAVLEAMIREGQPDAIALARKLRELNPERAIAAVAETVEPLVGRDRERLVSYLATQKGSRVDAFLLREVRRGPDLRSRLTAARTLERRGSEQWAGPLVAEFVRVVQSGATLQRRTSRDLIRFVVPSGNVQALEVLRRNYLSLSFDQRRTLLEHAARVPRNRSDRSAVCEAILVEALDDQAHWPHSWSGEGVRCVDAKLSEISAVLLSARMGQTFDPAAPPYVRARRIAELRNASLIASGSPPAPLPEAPTVPVSDDPLEVEAALFGLRAAVGARELLAAEARVRALGLPVVPRLKELVEARALERPALERATLLLNSLSSTVREVRVTDALGQLDERSVTDLRALIGAPLTATTLRGVLQERLATSPCTLRLSLHRDGLGRGLSLELAISALPPGASAANRVVYSLRTGKQFSRSSLTRGNAKQAQAGWARFEARLSGLLTGAHTVDGELRLRVDP